MGCVSSCAGGGSNAVRPHPGPPEPRVMRAQALYQQNKVDEALRELDDAIKEWPECARAYVERGRILAETQRLQRAMSDFSSAIKIQPDYLMALHMRSHAHLQMGQLEEAAADYQKAIRLDPDNGQLKALRIKIKKAVDEKRASGSAAIAAGSAGGDETDPIPREGSGIAPNPEGDSRPSLPAPLLPAGTAAARTADQRGDDTDPATRDGSGGAGAAAPTRPTVGSNGQLDNAQSFRSAVNVRVPPSPRNDDDPFSGLDTPTSGPRGGGAGNGRLKLCMVCMDKDRGCRLRPCMHAALCVECAEGLRARHYGCPICSVRIESVESGTFMTTFTTEEATASGLAALAAGLGGRPLTGGDGTGGGTSPLGGSLRTLRVGTAGPGLGLPQLEEGEAEGEEGEAGGAAAAAPEAPSSLSPPAPPASATTAAAGAPPPPPPEVAAAPPSPEPSAAAAPTSAPQHDPSSETSEQSALTGEGPAPGDGQQAPGTAAAATETRADEVPLPGLVSASLADWGEPAAAAAAAATSGSGEGAAGGAPS